MKSLNRRFENLKKKNSNWSSYICFAETIINQEFHEQTVRRWFYKLVDKNDYYWKDRNALLRNLVDLTKRPEDYKK
ncbi:MAG: hypothetical protein ABIE68_05115 [bacterium]